MPKNGYIAPKRRGSRAAASSERAELRGPATFGGAVRCRTMSERNRPVGLLQENATLRAGLEEAHARIQALEKQLPERTVHPVNFVWVFGAGRTGSTWLAAMMGEMPRHRVWFEPMLGDTFDPEKLQIGSRPGQDFVFAELYKFSWLRSIREFVLDAASVRFPETTGVLIVKEPHGSMGAPILSAAMPNSKMILLVREPRDTVASALDRFYLHGKASLLEHGGWGMYRGERTDADGFVERAARALLKSIVAAKRAYDGHQGPKTLVRYEDLRGDTLSGFRRVYDELGIPASDERLLAAVERHAFENVPEEDKGPGMRIRNASVGSWREELSPEQARVVAEVCGPILEMFYDGPEHPVPNDGGSAD